VANLSGGGDACHAKLQDSCLDDPGCRGLGLERETPPTDVLAKIEMQDTGLARAGSLR